MYNTNAIILKKDLYGEADVMLTALTRDFGKIRVMAQGIRKQEAKLRGHVEPLSHTAIGFIIGRNFYRLISADMVEFFGDLRQNSPALKIAYSILELIDQNLYEERGDGRMFGLLLEIMRKLNSSDAQNADFLKETALWFQAGFLHISGLLPEKFKKAEELNELFANHAGISESAGI